MEVSLVHVAHTKLIFIFQII